jgi:coenzyme F420-0:L-glutamate ligase/coenzyme F420-1:gamma-L-glutamate ligase
VVARRGPLRIVETRQGWVVAAAGIDASNVSADALVLLPEDSDASARDLRARIGELTGADVAVVVSDTFGRTWRDGLSDVAVGAAGIAALVDHRGDVDRHGNRLETTQIAVVDELASAADLVKGKLAGVPVAVVRGLSFRRPEGEDTGTRPLVRLGPGDLFPYGSRDLVPSRASADGIVPRDGALEAAASAFRAAVAALPEFPVVFRYRADDDAAVVDVHLSDPVHPGAALALGAVLGAALVQLHAEGWATRWEPSASFGGASLAGRLWLGGTA